MKEFKNLVVKTLKQKNKTQKSFSKELNIRPTKLNDVLCERIPFSKPLFEEICKRLELDETQINFNPKVNKYPTKKKKQPSEIELLKKEIEELKATIKTLIKMI